MPQALDGIRIEPPVSLPSTAATMPAATAAPEPPLLPPVMWSALRGFPVAPKLEVEFVAPYAHSCIFVFAKITAPALRRFATIVASCPCRSSGNALEHAVVG